jgi:hypothetical protein
MYGNTEMENILENKELINSYLSLSIQKQFNLNIDLKGEYAFAENLVSKRTIIAATFSDKILANPLIKMFLTSIITQINIGSCDTDFIKDQLKIL